MRRIQRTAAALLFAVGLGFGGPAVAAEPSPAGEEEAPAAAEEDDLDLDLSGSEDVEVVEPEAEPSPFDSASWKDPDSTPRIGRAINMMTAQTPRQFGLLILVDHRARQPFTDNTWADFFGLDGGGLKIGLGIRFGILDELEVGVYRLNGTNEIFDTYELDARYRFLKQDLHYLDVSVRVGFSWFFQPGMDDAFGGYGQLHVTRELFDRLKLTFAVMFHSDSSGATKSNLDEDWTLGLGGALELRIAKAFAVSFELSGGVAGYAAEYPAWSAALKFFSHRHVFLLAFSNTQYTTSDGFLAGSHMIDDVIIGFAIQREVNL